jgi:hypothetical protein
MKSERGVTYCEGCRRQIRRIRDAERRRQEGMQGPLVGR